MPAKLHPRPEDRLRPPPDMKAFYAANPEYVPPPNPNAPGDGGTKGGLKKQEEEEGRKGWLTEDTGDVDKSTMLSSRTGGTNFKPRRLQLRDKEEEEKARGGGGGVYGGGGEEDRGYGPECARSSGRTGPYGTS
uniref:Uncharacterized protein n=1 Tax=Chromera velia CCMP2878 TaxID=1169474 RepID=A0A0G4HFN8_9ALVE|eukprot:Cvel_6635.t1-p1 / transcript=Cvel_6635.t1 / gene=Cvel_6635 / organism=Chromera_velia_CCMP2878 / gene_product=hypothetical protein / transcript_product=hypothetical protein / location=Cvel_scaffold328:96275-98030(+) / protein_length=133 / sequence_SO=supercontig / SO=protein_coding / is_pseudo=false